MDDGEKHESSSAYFYFYNQLDRERFFWALYFLFTVPFFHEELVGNYELLTERILQLSLACVLVPAVLSGTGVMQYFFVRENGGRKAAGETKMYLERLIAISAVGADWNYPISVFIRRKQMITMPGQSAETISPSRNVC